MIPYSRNNDNNIAPTAVKIIGLGGAGANMLERIALDGMEGTELLALNTDVRTLGACIAREKIQLGANLTKGLGAGGDPELGHKAVLEAEAEIRQALKGRRIVFVCTGLGGGTGSGAAPIITRIAREEGAFVVVFATIPFTFEGKRRREQAEAALNELAVLSNALVTFDNNRMGELVLAKQGIHEAFVAADNMISESIKAVIRLVVRPGLINVGLDDLMSALKTNRSRCLFGSGIADGKDRASKALRGALASPLLDQGSLLKEAQTVLVHLCGGEDLTLFEVELLMQQLQKHVPDSAHVLFGAAVDPSMGNALSITLISALPEESLANAPRTAPLDTTADTPPAMEAKVPAPPTPVVSPPVAAPPPAPPAPVAAPPQPTPSTPPPPPPVKTAPAEPEFTPLPAKPAADAPAAPKRALLGEDRPFAEADEPPAVKSPFGVAPKEEPAPAKPAVSVFSTVTTSGDDAKPTAPPITKSDKPSADDPLLAKPPGFQQLPAKRPVGEMPMQPKPLPGEQKEPATPEPPPVSASDKSAPEPEVPKLKLGVKPSGKPQNELGLDTSPRGRFEGEDPNVVDGEDLDLPPFLRKKK